MRPQLLWSVMQRERRNRFLFPPILKPLYHAWRTKQCTCKTVQSNRQEANFPNLEEKENLKQFYLTQSRRLCPTVSVDRSELQRLGALHHKIKHFIKALTNLDRSWENGMPEMQKACLHFFSLQNSSRTECQKIFEEWAKWSNFLISASCYRGFVSQMLQDYQRQLRDLEKLLGGKPSETLENVSDR